MQKTYIVIGTSAAGIAAVQKIRSLDPIGRILCFSDEAEPPYNKCFLADFLGQHKELAAVYTKGKDFFKTFNIELHLKTKIVAIDRAQKTVLTAGGVTFGYDRLLLAVGGNARTYFGPSHYVRQIFPFYTLRDALKVQSWVTRKKPKDIFIVGAGLTGLEVADALRYTGSSIIVIEQQPRLLMRQLDNEGADFIAAAMNRCGVRFMPGVHVDATYSDGRDNLQEIILKKGLPEKGVRILEKGVRMPADMIIEAVGSSARLELPESAGLAIEKDAVVTNEWLQTSDPALFAAGDVALVKNKITGESVRTALWPDAVAQGMCAGANMTKTDTVMTPYPGMVPVATSTFFGISFHSAGFLTVDKPGWSEKVERTASGYAKIILNEQGVVKGFICMGDLISHMIAYKRSLVTETPLALK